MEDGLVFKEHVCRKEKIMFKIGCLKIRQPIFIYNIRLMIN